MDFVLSADQELVRDAARRLMAGACPTSLVRAVAGGDLTAGERLWAHLLEWLPLGEGPLVDLCLFLEENGAALAPAPFFAATALYAPLTGDAGRAGTVAMAGPDGHWLPNASTVKTFVLEVDRVEQVAVVLDGPRLVVVEPDQLTVRPIATLDGSRRVFEVKVPDGVAATAAPIEEARIERMLERAWVGLSAELLGVTRWLFDAALAYAKVRVQFDRPIGSFQAIQHKLADMALVRERAWAAVYYAAMAVDAGDPDSRRAAHVAKAAASVAARRCAKEAIQIHGGVGFTWEHDLHLFMRRAFMSERLLGTTGWHHDRIADLILR
jgi:alkylation response protein AidB-like acyl-CoA dehydrogenase